jgi:hypothetical protein
MNIAEWREDAYTRMFESTVAFVKHLKENDNKFKIEDLEAMLQSEYDRQGLAWDGRGEVVEINIEATIAAIQQELIKWKKELKESA